jgi:hypothetical protein
VGSPSSTIIKTIYIIVWMAKNYGKIPTPEDMCRTLKILLFCVGCCNLTNQILNLARFQASAAM